MKVLHISYSDRSGGAAIAAYRLNEAMNFAGIDSKMLVLQKQTKNNNIIQYRTRFQKLKWITFCGINKLIKIITNPFASFSFNFFGYNVRKHELVQNADIIYIHWINSNFLSLSAIRDLCCLNKPIVFYMHDMWHITGGCHHSMECIKFETRCNKCPMFHKGKGSKFKYDLSFFQFYLKEKYFSSFKNISIATPSIWLSKKVSKSSLFKNFPLIVNRNILNTEIFSPKNRIASRDKLKLPQDQKLILFGADNLSSPYKGWKFLKDAISDFDTNWTIVLFGKIDELKLSTQIRHSVISLGSITDEEKLSELFSACDVFVCPSLVDNYPNVILEASACGLPTVGFSVGGIPEMIINKETGYLVKLGDSKALTEGIKWVIDNNDLLRTRAREQVVTSNSYETVKVIGG